MITRRNDRKSNYILDVHVFNKPHVSNKPPNAEQTHLAQGNLHICNTPLKFPPNVPRLQLQANCRIRRIFFSDRLYFEEEEPPPEFKRFVPVQKNAA